MALQHMHKRYLSKNKFRGVLPTHAPKLGANIKGARVNVNRLATLLWINRMYPFEAGFHTSSSKGIFPTSEQRPGDTGPKVGETGNRFVAVDKPHELVGILLSPVPHRSSRDLPLFE